MPHLLHIRPDAVNVSFFIALVIAIGTPVMFALSALIIDGGRAAAVLMDANARQAPVARKLLALVVIPSAGCAAVSLLVSRGDLVASSFGLGIAAAVCVLLTIFQIVRDGFEGPTGVVRSPAQHALLPLFVVVVVPGLVWLAVPFLKAVILDAPSRYHWKPQFLSDPISVRTVLYYAFIGRNLLKRLKKPLKLQYPNFSV